MRRRFIIAIAPVVLLLILALVIPAMIASAQRQTSTLMNDRLRDANRFVSLTQSAMVSDDSRLKAELDSYAELYGTKVWVMGRNGELLHSAGTSSAELPEETEYMVDLAMAGANPTSENVVTPFGPADLTLVAPVGHDSQVSAALVLEFPTDAARGAVAMYWLLILVLAGIPALTLILISMPVASWVLRPVKNLEESITRMRRGEAKVRADIDRGPPELRHVARSFNEMSETVEATLERQQQFVADASHQLRNPLASVQVGLENLRPFLPAAQDPQETYEEAMQTVERMGSIVDDLLRATELKASEFREATGAGDTAPNALSGEGSGREVDLLSVPHGALQALARGYEGILDIELEPAWVKDPAGGFVTLLEELIDNAYRLGSARKVSVIGLAATSYVMRVEDDGSGMSEAEREHALTRFWRSPRHQNVPGTGLGLNILSEAVADIGGSLTLGDSSLGGLCVEVKLPLA